MTETFNLPVKVGASGENKLGVTTVQFGDGYKSKMASGINVQTSEWSVSMTGNADKIKPFTDFMKRHKGIKSFYWTPPLEEQGLFTVEKWKTDTHGAGLFTVSATFESVSLAGDKNENSSGSDSVMINDQKTATDSTWSSQKISEEIEKNKGDSSTSEGGTRENFKIIVFNEESQANPQEIISNMRHVFENPFPKQPVIVVAEIYANELWGDPGWIYLSTGGAAGVKASHILETDQIVLQSGQRGVGCTQSSYTGSPAGQTGGAYIYSAPCRIKIWKVG